MAEAKNKKDKTVSTRKKQKIVGHQEYINTKTGEVTEMQVISIEDRDANFHKIWLGHIIDSLDLIGNKKIKVLSYILKNLNSENLFIKTNRKMAEELNISLPTISETMKALQDADFLRRISSGVYAINPEIIFKGGTTKRMNVLIQYTQIEQQKKDDESSEDPSPNLKIVQ